jgi:hypothetical protein
MKKEKTVCSFAWSKLLGLKSKATPTCKYRNDLNLRLTASQLRFVERL